MRHVAAYATDYGPLLLCEHGLPGTHFDLRRWPTHIQPSDLAPEDLFDRYNAHVPTTWWSRSHLTEPVEQWLAFANDARTLLVIATALKNGRVVADETWAALRLPYSLGAPLRLDRMAEYKKGSFVRLRKPPKGQLPRKDDPARQEKDLRDQRILLASHVQDWLNWSDLHPRLQWGHALATDLERFMLEDRERRDRRDALRATGKRTRSMERRRLIEEEIHSIEEEAEQAQRRLDARRRSSARPTIELGGETHFAALALRLASTIVGTKRFAFCAGGCGQLVEARRGTGNAWCNLVENADCQRAKNRLDKANERLRNAGRV
jgi:hypothetical protein